MRLAPGATPLCETVLVHFGGVALLSDRAVNVYMSIFTALNGIAFLM